MANPLPARDAALLERAGLQALPPAAEGLFREDGWLRRVARENAVLLGGGRALLLEVAHPLVAAGVAEHSDFRRDPWSRLQRTLDAVTTLSFAPREAALAAARGVIRAHGRVRGRLRETVGPFAAGTPYSGRDPELVLWVWGTLVDSALAVYRDFVGPLEGAALAEYHRDQAALARLLGAPAERVPADPAAFRRWFDAVLASDALTVGREGREIGRAVLDRADSGPVRAIAAAGLPERLRRAYGLRWGERERARYRSLADSVRALRSGAALDGPGPDG